MTKLVHKKSGVLEDKMSRIFQLFAKCCFVVWDCWSKIASKRRVITTILRCKPARSVLGPAVAHDWLK